MSAKAVGFCSLIAQHAGSVDTTGVIGVDRNLIVKPFHQKGGGVSLREFSNHTTNHLHGMWAVERFGMARSGSMDFDPDDVTNELSVGDQTAITVHPAALAVPGQMFPNGESKRHAVLRGERVFEALDCTCCHRASLPLRRALFAEPNPFNPPGNLRPGDVSRSVVFDLSRKGNCRTCHRSRGLPYQ